MSIEEEPIGVLLARYSILGDREKRDFARAHPELRSNTAIAKALVAAMTRYRFMADTEGAKRYAYAALTLSEEIGDREAAGQAASLLSEIMGVDYPNPLG